MFLADLHIHSTFSDGKLTIPQLVDFYGSREFGAIAITDHLCEKQTLIEASYPLYLEILRSEAERAWRQYRMVLIPGVELTKNSLSNHRSAHILGLTLPKTELPTVTTASVPSTFAPTSMRLRRPSIAVSTCADTTTGHSWTILNGSKVLDHDLDSFASTTSPSKERRRARQISIRKSSTRISRDQVFDLTHL